MDRPVWEKSWVLERLRNCFWGRCCRPDGKAGGRGSTCSCSFSPLVCHGLWISARTLIVLKSEEWRQQDGEMDEAQLSLVILTVEERVVFWSLVWMSAGFATELLRGSLLVWIRGFRWFAGCDWWSLGTRKKSSSSVGKAGSPVCLAWFWTTLQDVAETAGTRER